MTKFATKLGAIAIAAAVIVGATGVAGAQTTADLQAQIAALLAQITSLQAQAGTSTGTTTSYTFTRDLTVGSTGADVKELQKFLNANGYTVSTSGAGSVGNESTYFGNASKAALIKFQAAKGITPSAGYFGAKTRAYIASMTTTTTPTTPTTTVGAPLSIALSSDNPASANVQKGSANNTVLKVTLTGGATATTVTGLTLKSYGTTEATGTTDVAAVKLFDENGIQIGNDRTPAGNQVNFVIVPALTIPANSTRTITVTANVGAATTNVMAAIRYGIESATSILGGTTFAGTYPVIGNSFTIVPAGQLGGVSVGKFGTVPKTTVKVGEKDIVVERFNISAGSNEDIAVNQITLTNSGSIADSDLTNIRLRQVGSTTVIAGPGSLSNKKVTFNLTTPISLIKGASINLEAVADIADGGTTGRQIAVAVATGGAVARGVTSGTNITSTGNTTASTITIGNEALVVSMSASHPQGSSALIIKTTNKKDLAKFDVRANGGAVILNSVTVTMVDGDGAFTGAANQLTSVGLYDGDSLISDLITVDASTAHSFSLNYTIPANTTKVLTVKGITNEVPADANGSIITTTMTTSTGYGLSSGEAITGTLNVSTTGVTVFAAGSVTPAADTTKMPYNQAILAPSNNVTLAALKLYAQREDMKLTDLVVTLTGAGAYDDEGDTSSVTLYADDGVTALTNPITFGTAGADDAVDTFTIGTSDFLNDVIFAKGVYKTILVKANISAGATGTTGLTVTIADAASNLKFVGQDSATVFDNSTAGDAVVFAIASPYAGGTFSADTKVLTLTKASTSPSGSVARGTQTVTGIWDINNYDSTNDPSDLTAITFTSKTGLPSVLDNTDGVDDALFSLYDGDGNLLAGGSGDTANAVLDKAAGTIAFTAVGLTINAGEPKQLKLLVDTTSGAKFTPNTQIQWSLELVGNATITGATSDFGYANGVWTIPAVANTVTLP